MNQETTTKSAGHSPLLKVYRGTHFPNTYLVVGNNCFPEKVVPFNLIYLFGELTLTRWAVGPSALPFSTQGRRKIVETVEEKGYCFYKWPRKILGEGLGDVLELSSDGSEKGNDPEPDT